MTIRSLRIPAFFVFLNRRRYASRERENVIGVQRKEIAFLSRFSPESARQAHIMLMIDRGEHEGEPVMVLMRCDENFNHV